MCDVATNTTLDSILSYTYNDTQLALILFSQFSAAVFVKKQTTA